ncbi:MAG: Gfo/Idh/MocA family protein [Clostridium sp.]|uniref:Gfo/Idh/MocA family protein n=1 Tax=Clostridium sp. TaxID=1506 RepID=UPI003D6C8ACF
MRKIKVGVVGCGCISDIYLTNLKSMFSNIELVGCADLIQERATEKAQKYEIKSYPNDNRCAAIYEDKEIEIIVNLTTPLDHVEVSLRALEYGKHVHGEKPLAVNREDAKKIIELAKTKGLMVGCAPDTFLGGGLQTCRKLIDDGWIGTPVALTAFMTCHGHESWHPDPEFYYKVGAGPMLDMGPYYVTALVSLLGPIKRVTGSTKITYSERTITSEKKFGDKIKVEIPTHVAGIIDFENGAIGTLITSFDVWDAHLPSIEIYGSEGSLSVPDPNTFGGPVLVKRANQKEWMEIPLSHNFSDNSRGIGVADMANAIRSERKNRASGELGYHVLDVMLGFQDASESGLHYNLMSTCEKPEALEMDVKFE